MTSDPPAGHPLRVTPGGRFVGHGLSLVAVLALVLVSALVPAPPRATTAAEEPAVGPGATAPALAGGVPAGAWMQCQGEVAFWSGPDDRAVLFTLLPAGALVRTLGAAQDGRLLVYYEGDNALRAPGPGWVEAGSVVASAGPAVAASPTVDDLALRPLVRPPTRSSATRPPRVTAQYVAIVDEDSGELLYDDGARVRTPPASVTKIATTIVALEREPNLQRIVDVTVNGAVMNWTDGSSVMWLEPGERVTVEALLYGMMLPSGNDAAEQIALTLGGTRERYVEWMNDKARSLGLQDTQFKNPSGMDADGHYSSAYDMALLARDSMRNAEFRRMAGAKHYYAPGYNLTNANRLIGSYAGADGVKIGYTDLAGKTIVASATRNGHRVYVSLMKSQDLPGDSTRLFEWVWDSFSW
jgi:D-alanyl-D-alanine carboxypeptidase